MDHAVRSDESRQTGALPSGSTSGRFEVLDGLRGVGAIMVLILHSAFVFPSISLVVDMFFMLSGFVLAHGYGHRLALAADRRRFVISRIIRLWPLYLLGCTIALGPTLGMALFGWSFWTVPVWILAVATAPFFVFLPYDGRSIPLNPPGWSLAFELLANAAFIFTGVRLSRVLPVWLIGAAGLLFAIYNTHSLFTGWLSFEGGFPRVFFSFFGGVLLHALWRSGRFVPPALPAALLLLVVVGYCLWDPPMHRTYAGIVLFLVNPAVIYCAAHSTARGRVAVICRTMGDLSYALYAVHVPVIMAVQGFWFLFIGADAATYGPVGATWWITQPLSIAVAWFANYHFDVPLRRKLMHRFLPRPAAG
jgi:hypothetical protein